MSKTINIESGAQFSEMLKSSKLVVADFYADWCGPCKQIAPIYEALSQQISRKNLITFIKINTDKQKEIAQAYGVTSLPTFIIFRDGNLIEKLNGADPARLREAVRRLSSQVAQVIDNGESASISGPGGGSWRGAELPRGYTDITSQVEITRCELLNRDEKAGDVRVLFNSAKPSALTGEKVSNKDWVESDTDEQLLLFMPFQSMLKLHSLQITSLPPQDGDNVAMRPGAIKLFSNKPHNLGFDEAESSTSTQSIELKESDWDPKTCTANVPLRFVKFQNISSLVVFVVKGCGSNNSEKVRIDRIRLSGEAGEKREMGKLEKIGDAPGE